MIDKPQVIIPFDVWEELKESYSKNGEDPIQKRKSDIKEQFLKLLLFVSAQQNSGPFQSEKYSLSKAVEVIEKELNCKIIIDGRVFTNQNPLLSPNIEIELKD